MYDIKDKIKKFKGKSKENVEKAKKAYTKGQDIVENAISNILE